MAEGYGITLPSLDLNLQWLFDDGREDARSTFVCRDYLLPSESVSVSLQELSGAPSCRSTGKVSSRAVLRIISDTNVCAAEDGGCVARTAIGEWAEKLGQGWSQVNSGVPLALSGVTAVIQSNFSISCTSLFFNLPCSKANAGCLDSLGLRVPDTITLGFRRGLPFAFFKRPMQPQIAEPNWRGLARAGRNTPRCNFGF
jgi:hypothetical protein